MTGKTSEQPTLFGHPTALFTLFFAEMWERFSYYGMRALLVFYITKGFLGLDDEYAYKIYYAYAAMVYLTPFFGGMLADRLIGQRRAVVLGGLLMAAGHLLMTIESAVPFYCALALLILGNGFFKPSISTIVGDLYEEGDPRRDGGFTLFYIGINLGAAMAPLLCGYVGETFGWHYGFGLATIGMLVGLAVFIVPTAVAQGLILLSALATALGMVVVNLGSPLMLAVNGFVAAALVVSAVSALMALNRGGLPPEAGAPPDPEALNKPIAGIPAQYLVYGGSLAFVPAFAFLVWSGQYSLIPQSVLEPFQGSESSFAALAVVLIETVSTLPGILLTVSGATAIGYLLFESIRSTLIERHRLWVAVIMMFFSTLFWSFFEQAGSSMNNFADRNVDRVSEEYQLDASKVGSTLVFRVQPQTNDSELSALPILDQEQLGYTLDGKPFTMTELTELRKAAAEADAPEDALTVSWPVTEEHVGMGVGGTAVPASAFQSANPIFILIFGLVFSSLWTFLGKRGLEPSTPVKFSLGLLQLGLGFGALWYGASLADDRGMVAVNWLLLGYMLHTTGELCLSPVGLSMITKLSPKRLVSTAMGAWFMSFAFSGVLAAAIASFTGVSEGGGGGGIPVPSETVHVYGGVFGNVGLAALSAAALCLLLAPLLKMWMHGVDEVHPVMQTEEGGDRTHGGDPV